MQNKIRKMLAVLAVLLSAVLPEARAQQIAINTDMLMDVAAAPNLGVELTLTKRSTLSVNALYSPKLAYRFGTVTAVQPEWRYYFSGRPMYRHFVGVGALWSDYDLKVKGRRYDGNAGGVGVTFGYVLPVGKRLLIDFHTSLGAIFFKQKEYVNGTDYDEENMDADGNVRTNAHGTMFLPMRTGVSLTYILR